MSTGRIILAFAMLCTLGCNWAAAQATPVDASRRPPEVILAEKLQDPNPEVARAAIDEVNNMLKVATNKEMVVNPIKAKYIKALLAAERYDEAAEMALMGLVNIAHYTDRVEDLMRTRINALLAAGKAEQALADAKSLYNVSTMKGTRDSIELFSQCLLAARKDSALVQRFRMEQFKGATPSTTQPAADPDTSVLASIKIEATRYMAQLKILPDDVLEKNVDTRYNRHLARGNLLLMAGKPKEARVEFEKARAMGLSPFAAQSIESIARSIRAEDGAVGRANQWIISGGALTPDELKVQRQ